MAAALKNTAIGSHAGPVGSITTSRRVAGAAPANAARSITKTVDRRDRLPGTRDAPAIKHPHVWRW